MKKEIIAILFLVLMLWAGLNQLDYHVNPWLDPVVKNGEWEAAKWVKDNTLPDSLFLAGIFGGELVMGMTSRTSLVGGDWAANTDSPKQMSDLQEFYQTDSPEMAQEIWERYNADYAWFPSRSVYAGYGWIEANETKMNDSRFELVYSNSEVRVYRLSGSS